MFHMFKLSKKINGKWIVDSVDSLRVINRRAKALRSSYRGQGVELKIEPCEDNNKYRKPLRDSSWRGGGYERVKYKNKTKIKAAKRKSR